MWTSVSPCLGLDAHRAPHRVGVPDLGSGAAGHQGLTLVHFWAHRKHTLWDTLGA